MSPTKRLGLIAPTGHNHTARGVAIGKESGKEQAPKGRKRCWTQHLTKQAVIAFATLGL